MSRMSLLLNQPILIKQTVRHYAPYLSILRPFSSAPSTATRPASSSPSPPLPNLTAKKGTSIPPTTTAASRTSSHSNVSSPIPRSVDIHKLDRFEEGESKRHDGTVSGLGQQDSDPDGAVDLGHDSDSSSHLTFNDIPLSQVLSSKSRYGSSLHSVPDDATISAAMELIKSLNIGAVLVRASSSDDDIVGIISTRDYIDKVSEGKHPTSAGVKEFMTESPVFAFDDDLAISCLELMTKHNFRHLPVRERASGRAIGLVSIGDLVRIMLKQYKESNNYLKDFIDGRY